MKVFRDPVHDIIAFDKREDRLYLDLINTKEFQRLRHIKQLGLSSFTYTGAEHTRLAHSIGVAHLMKRFITHLSTLKQESSQEIIEKLIEERDLAIVSALLHDIGHGPFSHAFEKVTGEDHETWSIRILQGKTEVNEVLEEYRTGFAKEVSDVIRRIHSSNIVVKLISSQLDTDRIDYLLRDSLMTGAKYGSFDLEWLINTLRVGEVNGVPEVGLDLEKGLSIAESFVLARYYMYKHVYFHKTTRCAELLVEKVMERVMELNDAGQSVPLSDELKIVLSKPRNNQGKMLDTSTARLDSYLHLNDHVIWYHIHKWANHEDKILSNLANRLILRDFYKSIKLQDEFQLLTLSQKINHSRFNGFPIEYLLLRDDASSSSYKDSYIVHKSKADKEEEEKEQEASEQIFLFKGEQAVELSSVSELINTLRLKKIDIKRWYVPKELKAELLEIQV